MYCADPYYGSGQDNAASTLSGAYSCDEDQWDDQSSFELDAEEPDYAAAVPFYRDPAFIGMVLMLFFCFIYFYLGVTLPSFPYFFA